MRLGARHIPRGIGKFFRLSLYHDNLTNYYETNFSLIQHHKYSLTELENMVRWERDVYINLLAKFIKEEKDKIAMKQAEVNSKNRAVKPIRK